MRPRFIILLALNVGTPPTLVVGVDPNVALKISLYSPDPLVYGSTTPAQVANIAAYLRSPS